MCLYAVKLFHVNNNDMVDCFEGSDGASLGGASRWSTIMVQVVGFGWGGYLQSRKLKARTLIGGGAGSVC